jgi:hypothetical protein
MLTSNYTTVICTGSSNKSVVVAADSSTHTVALDAAISASVSSQRPPIMHSLQPARNRIKPRHQEDFVGEITQFNKQFELSEKPFENECLSNEVEDTVSNIPDNAAVDSQSERHVNTLELKLLITSVVKELKTPFGSQQ